MAATMEHEKTSTTALETIGNTIDPGNINVSSPTGGETVDDSYGVSTKAEKESTKNGEKSANSPMQESTVSFSSTSWTSHAQKHDVDDDNKSNVNIDVKKDSGKQGTEGFKLPGLPAKPIMTKMHMPGVRHVQDATDMTELETKSDDFHQDQSKTKNDESSKTEHTSESKSGVCFTFPKPKLANIAKNTRPPQSEDSPSRDASDSESVSAAALPGSAEKKQIEKSPDKDVSEAPPLPYREPSWSGIPKEEYYLEVLKGGTIISKIALNDKAYHIFGRLETCDVPLEHPSLSRYHLVLQYRVTGDSDHDPGFYLYDLGSTHGSWFNKQQMEGRVFYQIRVGHMFKLGGSTRMYILQGPSEDEEEESELSVKELRELRQQQLAELEERKRQKKEEDEEAGMRQEEKKEKDAGISWGMDYEDADDADATGDNPFAIMTMEEKEATYIKDPKKALRGYFEREGYELEYSVEEKESGFSKQFVCKVELPIDDASGRPIFAEAAIPGKKKEAVLACALEACRILDARGVLRQATHESRKRKSKNWKDDDYYDSDEDTFLDRTGEIEKRRVLRMKKAGVIKDKVQTYDSLKSQLSDVEAELKRIETEMSTGSKSSASSVIEDDSLDAFMESIKSGKTVDKTWRAKLKLQMIDLKKEQVRLARLVDITRPATMPALPKSSTTQTSFAALSKKLPMFGSMKGRANLKPKLKSLMPSPKVLPLPSSGQKITCKEEEEVEDEQEQDDDEQEDVPSPQAAQISSQHTGSVLSADKPTVISRLSPVSETTQKPSPPESDKNGRKGGPSIPIEIRKLKDMEHVEGVYTRESPSSSTRRDAEPRKVPWDEVDETGTHERVKKIKMFKGLLKEREIEEKEDKEDYADWMPPVGQSGDGKTHLNAKFGY